MIKNKIDFIEKEIKKYNLFWFAFLFELIIMFIVFYYFLIPKELVQSKEVSDIFILYIAYIFAIISIPAISKIYSIFMSKASKKEGLLDKLKLFKIAFFIKVIVFQFSAILLLIAFYFNQIYSPLYLLAALLIAFLFNKPSVNTFIKDFSVKESNAILSDDK